MQKKKTQRSIVTLTVAGLLLVCVCVRPSAFATTFVALTTDQEGILAFDSKRMSTLQGHPLAHSPTCKIVAGKRSLYGIAGLSGAGDLNAYQIIAPLATGKPEALGSIRDALVTLLQQAVSHMSAEELQPYTTAGVPLTIVIALSFAPTPALAELAFYVNADRTIRPHLIRHPNPALLFSAVAMKPLVPPHWSALTDKVALVHSLMSAGIAADADSARPISLITVNAYGLRWIETGACTDRRR
ncbi:MAG: hypothetical protein AB7P69_24410 [Candidatus Binatia bacterium]